MSLSLVRVDDRLIHGQTVIMWSKYHQADALILLVPENVARDKFMVTVLKNAGNALKQPVYIFGIEEAIEKVSKAIKSEKKYYLISKTIQELYELRKSGVDYGDKLIFGTASQKVNSKKIANNIYLDKKDMDACDYLDEKGVEIIFKLIPDEQGISWKKAKEKVDL
ncbi:MAG: PTS sugar transporter subunit IIB [Candidatus Methanofastidiosa archaeon]|nr:PTS sugar transporter subunit IIB [Candidatus Methanofastidiosa archaeon]